MKLRALNIITSLFVAACLITSCLDDDTVEYEFSSNASITAFSITDSIITYYTAVVDGKDTTLSTSVIGTDYPFVIDQKHGLIYNADSLPVGTDVSKVVVGITADTYGIYIEAETDSLWEETDSLNFENPIRFKVISEIGTFGRTYTAQINVHQQDPDSLHWSQMTGNNFSADILAQKAVYLNHNIYVFAEQDEQVAMTMTSADDGRAWTALQPIDLPVKADYTSAMVWNGSLYLLAGGELYHSTNGLNWDKVETAQTFTRLLAATENPNSLKMIGVDAENHYIESPDGINWTRYNALPADFPESHTAYTTYSLTTNPDFSRIALLGNYSANTDTTTVIWTQLANEHDWYDLQATESTSACPKLENASLIHYNGLLYTFGGDGQRNGTLKPFSYFFVSEDNGINWEPLTSKVMFPESFQDLYVQAEGDYSCIVDDNHYIWIMWSRTGEVWRGRINKLGFDKQ